MTVVRIRRATIAPLSGPFSKSPFVVSSRQTRPSDVGDGVTVAVAGGVDDGAPLGVVGDLCHRWVESELTEHRPAEPRRQPDVVGGAGGVRQDVVTMGGS